MAYKKRLGLIYNTIWVRLTPDEKKEIQRVSKKLNMSMSAFARKCMIKELLKYNSNNENKILNIFGR